MRTILNDKGLNTAFVENEKLATPKLDKCTADDMCKAELAIAVDLSCMYLELAVPSVYISGTIICRFIQPCL